MSDAPPRSPSPTTPSVDEQPLYSSIPLTRVFAADDDPESSSPPAGPSIPLSFSPHPADSPPSSPRSATQYALHPYVRPLLPSDAHSCEVLEATAFPEHERCTREKFDYRLTTCAELSLGLFASTANSTSSSSTDANSTTSKSPLHEVSTAKVASPVETSRPQDKEVLIAHAVATKWTADVVEDAAMNIPSSWRSKQQSAEEKPAGHRAEGRTLALHSVAVVSEYQHVGLGSILLRAYLQRMSGSGIADRVAIIAHKEMVGWYENMGFQQKGESKATFGGGGWVDLEYDLSESATKGM